jgi:hypothetical protein
MNRDSGTGLVIVTVGGAVFVTLNECQPPLLLLVLTAMG